MGDNSLWLSELYSMPDFCVIVCGISPEATLFYFLYFLPFGLALGAVFVPKAMPAIPTA